MLHVLILLMCRVHSICSKLSLFKEGLKVLSVTICLYLVFFSASHQILSFLISVICSSCDMTWHKINYQSFLCKRNRIASLFQGLRKLFSGLLTVHKGKKNITLRKSIFFLTVHGVSVLGTECLSLHTCTHVRLYRFAICLADVWLSQSTALWFICALVCTAWANLTQHSSFPSGSKDGLISKS